MNDRWTDGRTQPSVISPYFAVHNKYWPQFTTVLLTRQNVDNYRWPFPFYCLYGSSTVPLYTLYMYIHSVVILTLVKLNHIFMSHAWKGQDFKCPSQFIFIVYCCKYRKTSRKCPGPFASLIALKRIFSPIRSHFTEWKSDHFSPRYNENLTKYP